jgi:hypothetical protein
VRTAAVWSRRRQMQMWRGVGRRLRGCRQARPRPRGARGYRSALRRAGAQRGRGGAVGHGCTDSRRCRSTAPRRRVADRVVQPVAAIKIISLQSRTVWTWPRRQGRPIGPTCGSASALVYGIPPRVGSGGGIDRIHWLGEADRGGVWPRGHSERLRWRSWKRAAGHQRWRWCHGRAQAHIGQVCRCRPPTWRPDHERRVRRGRELRARPVA